MRTKQGLTLDQFVRGEIAVLVATKAIQFGVDLPLVRRVVFVHPSTRRGAHEEQVLKAHSSANCGQGETRSRTWSSLLDLEQQMGRAGRNGPISHVDILVDPASCLDWQRQVRACFVSASCFHHPDRAQGSSPLSRVVS